MKLIKTDSHLLYCLHNNIVSKALKGCLYVPYTHSIEDQISEESQNKNTKINHAYSMQSYSLDIIGFFVTSSINLASDKYTL